MNYRKSKWVFVGLTFILSVALTSQGQTAEPIDWKQDIASAIEQANASSKDLLVLFTGRGWCGPCDALEANVLSENRFCTAVCEHFIMVELNFPADESERSSQEMAELKKQLARYEVSLFPTIILMEATGRPYASISKYASSTGPEPLFSSIQTARDAKRIRDEHFTLASNSNGLNRVMQWHHGLEAIAPHLRKADEHSVDPLLKWYRSEIDAVLSFESHLLNDIKAIYQQRIQAEVSAKKRSEVDAKLHEFEAHRDYGGAVSFLDAYLTTADDDEHRFQIELSRIAFLERDKQFERALTQSRALLESGSLDPTYQERLRDREVYNLFSLGRIDEALAHYDSRIVEAGEDLRKQHRLLGQKAQHAYSRLEPELSIPIWETYRNTIGRKSDDWFDATVLLARLYQKDQQHRQAIALFEEAITAHNDVWILIDLIHSHQALGNSDQAKQLYVRIQAEQTRLVASSRASDRDEAKAIEVRLREVSFNKD